MIWALALAAVFRSHSLVVSKCRFTFCHFIEATVLYEQIEKDAFPTDAAESIRWHDCRSLHHECLAVASHDGHISIFAVTDFNVRILDYAQFVSNRADNRKADSVSPFRQFGA